MRSSCLHPWRAMSDPMPYLRLPLLLLFLLSSTQQAIGQVEDIDVRDALMPWIEREIKAKKIPSLSIAVVDDQRVVFSASVGYTDPKTKALATPDTPYRVGSVSKPFTGPSRPCS